MHYLSVSVDQQLVIDTGNVIIAVFTGLILLAVQRIFKWVKQVNDRLARIEEHLGMTSPDQPPEPGHEKP